MTYFRDKLRQQHFERNEEITREMEKNDGDEGAAVKKMEDEWGLWGLVDRDVSEEDSMESDESEDFSEITEKFEDNPSSSTDI